MNSPQSLKIKKKKDLLSSASIYESPLTCFRESLEILPNIVNNNMTYKRKKLRNIMKKLNERNTSSTDSSQNSIIVINSDNETNDAGKEDMSLSIIECSTSTDMSSPQQQRIQNKKLFSSRNKRPSIILLDNDSSFVQCSGQSFRENIAPSQVEDDIVELWSCLGNTKVNENTSKEYNQNRTKRNFDFVIDRSPNMNNLECLKVDTAFVSKKQKCDILNTNMLSLNESMTHTTLIKHSKESKKKQDERCNSNNKINSNFVYFDAHYSKRKSRNVELNKVGERFRSTSKHKLREIIVDGCNVAKMYTHDQEFSEQGIKLVVNYFKSRGHVVKVFLPNHVRRKNYLFLEQLYKEGIVIFTPSRCINGKKITPYDDRYILEYATKCEGIVISSDQYRDLYEEKPEWRDTILNRLLMPTFVGDYIMFPEDPLGKFGPNLETFLRHS